MTSINRLILIIDGQSITKIFVIIDYHQSIIDGNRSINIIDCYQYAISIDYLFSQTFQLSISSSTNKLKLHILISLLLGIPHGRSSWTWASAQTYKERRRKRNNNTGFNRVGTIIICAVFHGATSTNNSQTLLLRFKNNIRSAYTPAIPEDTGT